MIFLPLEILIMIIGGVFLVTRHFITIFRWYLQLCLFGNGKSTHQKFLGSSPQED